MQTTFVTTVTQAEDVNATGLPVPAGRARRLAEALAARHEDALLYRRLATLRRDVPLAESLDDLAWRGARPEFRQLSAELGADDLPGRVGRWLA